ncbi:MAG: HAD family hydrolase [Trueperaceae bacterium]|nr:HAD family hydrolase [Trueperaceae bacterium]
MLFAFDLDNTIVTRTAELPGAIVESLNKLRESGHEVSVLTGRPPLTTLPFLGQLKIKECYSTNHGAYVIGKAGKVLRENRLKPTDVQGLLAPFLKEAHVEYACIAEDTVYVKNPNDERWHWAHTQNRYVKIYEEGLELHADKLVFSTLSGNAAIRAHVETNHAELLTYSWNDGYLEVTSPNSDKGSALALIAAELGYEASDVIAFGDGPNDVTMLEWAGRAIAVGPHVHDEVLAVSDEHIPSPEELGVKTWLEQNVLKLVES